MEQIPRIEAFPELASLLAPIPAWYPNPKAVESFVLVMSLQPEDLRLADEDQPPEKHPLSFVLCHHPIGKLICLSEAAEEREQAFRAWVKGTHHLEVEFVRVVPGEHRFQAAFDTFSRSIKEEERHRYIYFLRPHYIDIQPFEFFPKSRSLPRGMRVLVDGSRMRYSSELVKNQSVGIVLPKAVLRTEEDGKWRLGFCGLTTILFDDPRWSTLVDQLSHESTAHVMLLAHNISDMEQALSVFAHFEPQTYISVSMDFHYEKGKEVVFTSPISTYHRDIDLLREVGEEPVVFFNPDFADPNSIVWNEQLLGKAFHRYLLSRSVDRRFCTAFVVGRRTTKEVRKSLSKVSGRVIEICEHVDSDRGNLAMVSHAIAEAFHNQRVKRGFELVPFESFEKARNVLRDGGTDDLKAFARAAVATVLAKPETDEKMPRGQALMEQLQEIAAGHWPENVCPLDRLRDAFVTLLAVLAKDKYGDQDDAGHVLGFADGRGLDRYLKRRDEFGF